MGGKSEWQWKVFCAMIFTWLIIYLSVYRGVKMTS